MAVAALPDTLIDELVAICGEEHVFTGRSALFNRARVPSPFPAHRWEEFIPQAVVLPTSAEQVSEVVKLANRERVPVVPRAGGTGLTDGAVPLRRGILVDVKLMNQIHEIDLDDRTVTVAAGHQHAEAQRGAAAARLHLSRRPRVLPVLARRRADRDERLVADRRPIRPHARPRDQLRDRAAHRRDHPGRRRRRQEGAQVVVGLPAQAPVHGPPGNARDRHRGDARARATARGGVLGVLRLSTTTWTPGRRPASFARSARPRSPASCSSTSGRSPTCAATTRPTSRSPTGSGRSLRSRCTATTTRSGPAAKRILRIGKGHGGAYLGDEISAGRLGVAPRPLRDAAARARPGRPGRADELALRGRGDPLLRSSRRSARSGTRSPLTCASATTCSTTGACSPTRTAPTSRGATT